MDGKSILIRHWFAWMSMLIVGLLIYNRRKKKGECCFVVESRTLLCQIFNQIKIFKKAFIYDYFFKRCCKAYSSEYLTSPRDGNGDTDFLVFNCFTFQRVPAWNRADLKLSLLCDFYFSEFSWVKLNYTFHKKFIICIEFLN